MKAVGYTRNGDSAVLKDIELARPKPSDRDLLVAVKAVSVNPVDTKVRANTPGDVAAPKVLGWDASGVVVAVGQAVQLFRPGDEVFYTGTIDRPGTNADYHLVDERIVGRKPATLDHGQAAALPLTALTAWELLFDRLRVERAPAGTGGTILIVNGAGGVGSVLVQLARRLTNLTVVATASRPETVDWVRTMGAHHVVDHRKPLASQIRDLGIEQVEFVAGLTGTDRQLDEIAEIIAPQGHLALIDDVDLDIGRLKPKSVSVSWEMVFTRPLFRTADMIRQHEILNELADLVDRSIIVTTLTRVAGEMSAATLREAHDAIEAGTTIGKIVLTNDGDAR
ncbi:zinc-binding alcohol dehydrogenase family protein [Sphingomonas sp. BE138]|uniref:zinc-binding alcohol dehydrogenase family protein n=1 Tax=Sphingomonas sp. BE138 TaxID=2817845 RepID=UPI002866D996|nr:zinc-binding alcohol dehydrogenase family protein [Sphingomonas sp. BE138]MDR6788540.1 zinc-binding alcohol dehydrogenase family protein [Sphingomonas sp. BE138]